jgi:hypothetical protein
VIVNQPRLYDALVRHVGDLGLGLSVHLIDVPPVVGAIALGKQSRTHAPSN